VCGAGFCFIHLLNETAAMSQQPMPKPASVTLSRKEAQAYSLSRAIELMSREGPVREADALELEISADLRREMGPDHSPASPRSFIVPFDVPVFNRAGLDSATSSKGAEIKFDQPQSWIDMLRAQSVTGRAGATFISGLQGTVKFPRLTNTVTVNQRAENPGSDISDSNLLMEQVSMSPKLAMATTSYSRQLLIQSALIPSIATSVDNMVRGDLTAAHAVNLDSKALIGTGTNEPLGMISVSGVGSVTLGANGGALTYAKMCEMERVNAVASADYITNAFVTTPVQREKMRTTDRTTAVTGWTILADNDGVVGHRVLVSNSVPANLTKGTATTICSAILFCNWAELLIGHWGPGFEIVVDPYKLKKQGMVELTSIEYYDCALRHPASFTRILDAL